MDVVQGFAVPKKVVEALKEWRSILADVPAFLRFAVLLTARPFVGESGRQLLSEQIVYRVFGYPVRYRSGEHPPVEQLLSLYAAEADGAFEWTGYHPKKGYAREARADGIPKEIRRLHRRLSPDPDETCVIAPTMKTANSRNRKAMRERSLTFAESYAPAIVPPAEALRVCRYMNSRSPRTFAPVRAAYADLREQARQEFPPAARRQAVGLLDQIAQRPTPIYRPADFTARPVAPLSMQQLPADLRAAAWPSEGFASLDLSKAQLAIAVRDWQELAPGADTALTVEMLREHRAGRLDVWADLKEHIGFTGSAGKAAVKRGTYAVVYGAGRGLGYAIREGYRSVASEYPPTESVRRFREHPMIAELLEAREHALSALREKGGAVDAFGRRLALADFSERTHPARSLLASLAQSRELWLMMPAFELAEVEEGKSRAAFEIVLYVYDGITIRARQTGRTEAQVRKVQKAVNERARAGGYLTRLEREW